jgi:hypothetical protein
MNLSQLEQAGVSWTLGTIAKVRRKEASVLICGRHEPVPDGEDKGKLDTWNCGQG